MNKKIVIGISPVPKISLFNYFAHGVYKLYNTL